MTDAVPPTRPPRAWLAALLSVLQPGMGHLYLWRPREAVGIWGAAFVLAYTGLFLFVRAPSAALVVAGVVVVVAAYAVVARHAWKHARSAEVRRRPERSRLVIVMIAFAGIAWFINDRTQAWFKAEVAEPFRIASNAMEPTLFGGDWVFVQPRKFRALAHDRLYTYRFDGFTFAKRLVGLPGDTLAMRAGVLVRNGMDVREPYSHDPSANDWGPAIVPPAHTFFLGDNRNQSRDSRDIGFIPDTDVVGMPTFIYFSYAPEGVRWGRLARRLE